MLLPIPHFEWQVLRAALRAEAAGALALGRDLRLVPTRRTKDGTFLDDLVRGGLLKAVGRPEPVTGEADVPPPFRARYRLTTLGRHAAEYGEYDDRDAPPAGTDGTREAEPAARPAPGGRK